MAAQLISARQRSQSSDDSSYGDGMISPMAQFAIDNWSDKPDKFLPALSMAHKLGQKSLADVFFPLAANLPIDQIESFRNQIPADVMADLVIHKSKLLQTEINLIRADYQ